MQNSEYRLSPEALIQQNPPDAQFFFFFIELPGDPDHNLRNFALNFVQRNRP